MDLTQYSLTCSLFNFPPIEPIAGSAPKISVASKLSSLFTKSSSPVSLSCPAQGSPRPSFR